MAAITLFSEEMGPLLKEYFQLFPWPPRQRNLDWFAQQHPEFKMSLKRLTIIRKTLLTRGILQPSLAETKEINLRRAKRRAFYESMKPVHPAYDVIKQRFRIQQNARDLIHY